MPYARDYYGELADLYGSEFATIPIGDPLHENAAHTTVNTVGAGSGGGLVFTYSEARTLFDRSTIYRGRGRIPLVPFNGIDEYATTPDVGFYSVDDSGDAGFSMFAWCYLRADSALQILSKWETTGNQREWSFNFDAANVIQFIPRDEANSVNPNRSTDLGIPLRSLRHVGFTYDGAGGASAMDTVTFYVDGRVVASTAANNASYVNMVGGTGIVELARRDSSQRFYTGMFAGGPLGPTFMTHNGAGTPAAADIRKMFLIGEDALKDLPLIKRIRGMR